jgi:tRNA threonylcarbamoyladenosine biosynthesis protein TsaB
MAYLFLDTSSYLNCGILDSSFNWLDYISTDISKSSGHVHGVMDKLLGEHSLSWETLDGLIVSSGPGSYTGMRVSEGIAQILEIDNLPVYSFYHFEIISDLGMSGYWISEAFKGEFFFYDTQSETARLLNLEQLILELEKCENIFALDRQVRGVDYTFQSTLDLLKENPSKVFSKITSSSRRQTPYYYRPEDVEFTLKAKKEKHS